MNTTFPNALKATALAALVACCAIATTAAEAQTLADDALRNAAQKALQTSPDVTARFNAYRAATNEIDTARSGYYPRIDANADVGRTSDRTDGSVPPDTTFTQRGVGLSLTQMLWDGFSTRGEVQRLDHARAQRWFEFVDASEQAALEAARAHVDVLRYRRLVALAEDNYVQHKAVYEQIQSRVKAGVGRGVDLEQVIARLALAESNLNSEVANLHDVTARFHRVVGEPPAAPSATVTLAALGSALRGTLPASYADALNSATDRNASVSAAIESLRSIRAQAEGVRSAYQPKLEARLRSSVGSNLSGNIGQRRDSGADLVLNWNLFNGGRDDARTRQFADLLTQAGDQRDRACRDVRQTTAIAYNDTQRLGDQLVHLKVNTEAIEHARDAYRQQFDIGQRSLLDVLNAENEVYTARRQYANAEHDLQIAYARTHAATNTLLPTLGLTRLDATDPVAGWARGEDAALRCDVPDAAPVTTAMSELDARAAALAAQRPSPKPEPKPKPTTP